jgi:hypothetical protein
MTAVTRADLKNITDRLDSIDQKLHTSEGWSARADERFTRIDERFTRIDERFTRIDERFTRIDERFERVDAQFDALRREMQEGFAENRAFFNLLLDEVRGQQRLLAEGHTALQSRVDGHDRDLAAHDERHGRHDLRLLRVEEHTGLPPYAESPAQGPKRRRR